MTAGGAKPKKLVLTVIDAMKPAMLERAVATGRAPALKFLIETGRPSRMSRFIGLVNALSGPFTPRRCRSENWPLDMKIE